MKKKKVPLPAEGAAFVFPLADGRFSVCRVLGQVTRASAKGRNRTYIQVAGSAWIGEKLPDTSDPALRPILYLTHHAWNNAPQILWFSEPPPTEFTPIGFIPSTEAEQSLIREAYASWDFFPYQALAEWRWKHEREAVLAEDALNDQTKIDRVTQAEQARREYLAKVTLKELLGHQFLSNWKTYPSRQGILASRQILLETVEKLVKLGPTASEPERMLVLQHCIEALNTLHSQLNHFIETGEREDLCWEFEAIVHACGLSHYDNLADRWRDW